MRSNAMNTRRLIAIVVVALPFVVASCRDDKEMLQFRQEIGVLKKDAEVASKRVAALEKQLDESQKQQAADNRILVMFVGRVQRVESVLGERLYGAQPTILEKALADIATLDRVGQKPKLSVEPPPIDTTPRPVAPVRSQPSTSGPSQSEITAANNFFSADDMVIRKCNSEWPGDARMADYCAEKQRKAVAQLKDWSSRPFGMPPDKFNPIRVACFKEWPNDFAMRVYCEGKKLGQ